MQMSAYWLRSSTNAAQVVNITKTVAKSIAKTPVKSHTSKHIPQTWLHAANTIISQQTPSLLSAHDTACSHVDLLLQCV